MSTAILNHRRATSKRWQPHAVRGRTNNRRLQSRNSDRPNASAPNRAACQRKREFSHSGNGVGIRVISDSLTQTKDSDDISNNTEPQYPQRATDCMPSPPVSREPKSLPEKSVKVPPPKVTFGLPSPPSSASVESDRCHSDFSEPPSHGSDLSPRNPFLPDWSEINRVSTTASRYISPPRDSAPACILPSPKNPYLPDWSEINRLSMTASGYISPPRDGAPACILPSPESRMGIVDNEKKRAPPKLTILGPPPPPGLVTAPPTSPQPYYIYENHVKSPRDPIVPVRSQPLPPPGGLWSEIWSQIPSITDPPRKVPYKEARNDMQELATLFAQISTAHQLDPDFKNGCEDEEDWNMPVFPTSTLDDPYRPIPYDERPRVVPTYTVPIGTGRPLPRSKIPDTPSLTPKDSASPSLSDFVVVDGKGEREEVRDEFPWVEDGGADSLG
ncbi:unnamed protein product [Periconia digitata]|uniref:Uncharacterized protein n=1 Tax=Periconia digitata TaxID=1303443 RepID=A0A9W4US86_9PLEO|nr:unnamed protein product [Periconia digitata]